MKTTRIVGLVLLILAIMMWLDVAIPYVDSLDFGHLSGLLGQTSAWWSQKLLSILMLPLSLMLIRR